MFCPSVPIRLRLLTDEGPPATRAPDMAQDFPSGMAGRARRWKVQGLRIDEWAAHLWPDVVPPLALPVSVLIRKSPLQPGCVIYYLVFGPSRRYPCEGGGGRGCAGRVRIFQRPRMSSVLEPRGGPCLAWRQPALTRLWPQLAFLPGFSAGFAPFALATERQESKSSHSLPEGAKVRSSRPLPIRGL